jgi:antitoxin VapB
MPLSIKDPEADRLARALAQRTGETLTEAVINALRERLERELRKDQLIESLIEDVMDIGRHCAALPLLDPRQPGRFAALKDLERVEDLSGLTPKGGFIAAKVIECEIR